MRAKRSTLIFCLLFRTLKTTGMQNLQNFDKVVTKDPMELESGPEEDTALSLEISSDKSTEIDPEPASLAESGIGVSEALQTASPALVVNPPETSFRPLELSETRSTSQSSNWSQHEDTINKSNEELQQPNKVDTEVKVHAGAKVNDYLSRIEQLRTDKRFQISLASLEQSRDLPGDSSKMSLNTDLDSTTLTEAKFRKGLESSIDMTEEDGTQK